jgi:hypothetical protein
MNSSFLSTDIYLTNPESTFCPLFFSFGKKKFGVLEKSAFIKKTKQILSILHKI